MNSSGTEPECDNACLLRSGAAKSLLDDRASA